VPGSTLEGYEIDVDRVHCMSERRQQASQTYLAVNTAIVGVLGSLVPGATFDGWALVAVSLPLFLVGIAACLVWNRIISDFRTVIGWHYRKLREIEAGFPVGHRVCTETWESLFAPRAGKERFGFSRLEAWLPRLFIGLYAVYFAGLVAAAAMGWV